MSAELAGMVLKCNKTGKLFFSHKEAETHGEETGLADFSQVSLEEQVWVCAETGKWCFNETEMDLHKRRVPEAQTFEVKTIADLKAAHEARKKDSAVDVSMETEEDAILREAGVKGKGKGKAAEPVRTRPCPLAAAPRHRAAPAHRRAPSPPDDGSRPRVWCAGFFSFAFRPGRRR